jgi:flagellin FlaB
MWKKLKRDEKAFTGLEAAIVLIAFVVVAAVFSYVMLGAGFFTTQKSQEVVHTGVQQASSSVELTGDVVIQGDSDGNEADKVIFYITNTAGGTPVDLDKTILSYADDDEFKGDVSWTYTGVILEAGESSADNLVEKGEKYKIEVDLTASNLKSTPTENEEITLELKPPVGAVLIIKRTLPPEISADNYYVVY